MIATPTLPSITQLRACGATPHYFGLGFIQLKLNDVRRLHFWVPEWPSIPGAETELHNHRYPFSSTVLQGAVVQEVFRLPSLREVAQEGDLEVLEVSCKPGGSEEPKTLGYAKPLKILHLTTRARGQYVLGPDDYHCARVLGPTITCVDRGRIVADTARILREPGSAFSCPFSIDKSPEECWERIEQMLSA